LAGIVVAVAVCAGGAAAAFARAEDGSGETGGIVVVADTFALRGGGDATALAAPTVPPVGRFEAGRAVVDELVAYAAPAPQPGAAPVVTAPNPTHEGFPLVVSVIDRTADREWLQVRIPQRPNGTTGWVRAADVQTWRVDNRIEVSLTTHTLRVYDGTSDVVLFETDVATGRPNTPTPVGDFHIDIVNPLFGHDVYGWGQLSVSGYSDVLERFAGGIGQIAIHGWNDDSVMGSASSNGCVRMRNVDIARVADLAPLGTPVRIVA
jgi:lipoprotein-anchoring transpeptidase ErfK/SrfK